MLPEKVIRRTYTRCPGSTKKVSATCLASSSTSGTAFTLAKGVAVVPEPLRQAVARCRDEGAGEDVSLADPHEVEEFRLVYQQLPADLNPGYRELIALGDVDGNVDILLVGSNRNLRGVDGEVHVSVIEVVRAQRLEIRRELLLGVLIGLREHRPQPTGAQLEEIEQIVLVEREVADHVDALDLCDAAFRDVESHRHAIALQRRHGALDAHAIASARKIGAPELLLDAIEDGAVEHLPYFEVDLPELLAEHLRGDAPVAFELHARDGRTLDERYEQRAALPLQAHILEEAGLKEGSNRFRSARSVNRIADLQGKVIEDGPGRDALQPLEPNVLDHKGILGTRDRDGGHDQNQGQCGPCCLQ